jgi:uncharacterized protein
MLKISEIEPAAAPRIKGRKSVFSSFERHCNTGRAICLAVAALLFLVPAAKARQAQAPAAAPAAAAAESSPTHLAAARELVKVSGMSRSFDAAIPQMIDRIDSTFTQTRPELIPDLHAVLKEIKPDFAKDADQMVDRAAHIYARLLTEKEIKAAVAFFTSDGGKKYVQAQPIFFNDVINAMQDWRQQVESALMTRLRAEMKKKGHVL